MQLVGYLFPVVFAIPVFDIVGVLFGVSFAADWLWWRVRPSLTLSRKLIRWNRFSPSLSYVGQGIIMGFPTTVSMNMGMVVGWAVLSPLAKHKGWAPGKVGSSTDGSSGWIVSAACGRVV